MLKIYENLTKSLCINSDFKTGVTMKTSVVTECFSSINKSYSKKKEKKKRKRHYEIPAGHSKEIYNIRNALGYNLYLEFIHTVHLKCKCYVVCIIITLR